MKIQVLSDLHLEFEHYAYPNTDCDVVVLAGDIHIKDRGLKWALEEIKHCPVIFVLGNHDFYGKTYPALARNLRESAKGTNVHILENDCVRIGQVNFLGCTLWTNFELFGNARISGYECQQLMSDYKKVRRDPQYAKLRSIDTAAFHSRSVKWLADTLDKLRGESNIVVTHHAPSLQSVANRYREDPTAAAYASNLEEFILSYQPDYWLHGHLHSSSNYKVGECRVLCNPRGYPDALNPDFDPEMIIEIGT